KAEGECPSRGGLAEGQAPREASCGDRIPQDGEQPEPTKPKDALVAAIVAIEAGALPMMHTRGGQMRQPPEAEKDDQEQPIETRAVGEHSPFPIPAAAFEVLEGGFHAHPAGIVAKTLASRGPIGDDDPGLPLVRFPSRTYLGSQRALLPELDGAVPLLP